MFSDFCNPKICSVRSSIHELLNPGVHPIIVPSDSNSFYVGWIGDFSTLQDFPNNFVGLIILPDFLQTHIFLELGIDMFVLGVSFLSVESFSPEVTHVVSCLGHDAGRGRCGHGVTGIHGCNNFNELVAKKLWPGCVEHLVWAPSYGTS